MRLGEIGEFGLIGRIAGKVAAGAGVRLGIGDDAAVTETEAGRLLLSTADMLVEGIHFDLSFTDPFRLGRKSLAVNVSDIAAMGGHPRHALLCLAIPADLPVEFLDRFADGVISLAEEFGVTLIGGDTCRSSSGLVISITLHGEQSPRESSRAAGHGRATTCSSPAPSGIRPWGSNCCAGASGRAMPWNATSTPPPASPPA